VKLIAVESQANSNSLKYLFQFESHSKNKFFSGEQVRCLERALELERALRNAPSSSASTKAAGAAAAKPVAGGAGSAAGRKAVGPGTAATAGQKQARIAFC
jgi:hypothetical protein